MHTTTPAEARALADDASEAIRALNHATHPADWCPGLLHPADAYAVLGALHELVYRLPQLFAHISAFLQRLLQHDVIAIDGGDYVDDSLGAIGTASNELEGPATEAARRMAVALDAARQAIAFATYTGEPFQDDG